MGEPQNMILYVLTATQANAEWLTEIYFQLTKSN